jgi:hypothetical protein
MHPRRAIRRFDIFAEYRKQEEEAKGVSEDVAKGYGLWVAKVVASRRYRGVTPAAPPRDGEAKSGEQDHPPLVDGKWHVLGDEAQTEALFEREIVQRMGEDFYREVFVPAIRQAREQGKSYEGIRDSLRKNWIPQP